MSSPATKSNIGMLIVKIMSARLKESLPKQNKSLSGPIITPEQPKFPTSPASLVSLVRPKSLKRGPKSRYVSQRSEVR